MLSGYLESLHGPFSPPSNTNVLRAFTSEKNLCHSKKIQTRGRFAEMAKGAGVALIECFRWEELLQVDSREWRRSSKLPLTRDSPKWGDIWIEHGYFSILDSRNRWRWNWYSHLSYFEVFACGLRFYFIPYKVTHLPWIPFDGNSI